MRFRSNININYFVKILYRRSARKGVSGLMFIVVAFTFKVSNFQIKITKLTKALK